MRCARHKHPVGLGSPQRKPTKIRAQRGSDWGLSIEREIIEDQLISDLISIQSNGFLLPSTSSANRSSVDETGV